MSETYPQLTVTSRRQWRDWLTVNSTTTSGVWVVTWKKGSGHPHVDYDDIVEEAIAAGWVDSQPKRVDEQRSALRVTPRTPRSRWSKKNKERVAALTAAGLMKPGGVAVVEAAKASGSWNALSEVEALREPDDLNAALNGVAPAREHFDAFPPSTKRAILEWISAAKTEQTRAARVERTVADAAVNVRANQWRQPKAAARATPSRSA